MTNRVAKTKKTSFLKSKGFLGACSITLVGCSGGKVGRKVGPREVVIDRRDS